MLKKAFKTPKRVAPEPNSPEKEVEDPERKLSPEKKR